MCKLSRFFCAGCAFVWVGGFFGGSPLHDIYGHLSKADTHTPDRYASVFRAHSDTQAVPALHCIRMLNLFSLLKLSKTETNLLRKTMLPHPL